MKAVVAAFNQEKALVGAFSVITTLRMELFQALLHIENIAWDWAQASRAPSDESGADTVMPAPGGGCLESVSGGMPMFCCARVWAAAIIRHG